MIWPLLETIAQAAIGRVLNSLPEGMLLVLFAGVMLRLSPRQNSRTRFAVWFIVLLAVAVLPLARLPLPTGLFGGHTLLAADSVRPLLTLSGHWGLVLFLAWILVASIAVLRLVVGLWRLRAVRKSCVVIDGADLDPRIQETIDDFRSSRSVTLATSGEVSVPSAIGFFRPMIVIPAWALRELTPEELKVILLHEFAHVRRRDAWTNLLQKVVHAVFVFHPVVWWIESRLSLEREMACDDHVLAETANPRGYAKCLVALLEKSIARRGLAMAQAAVRRAREASLRLARILDARRPHVKHAWKPVLGVVGAFSLICLVAAPRLPELVAFEGNEQTILANVPADVPAADMHSAVIKSSQSPSPAAAVIPASIRTRPSPSLAKMPQRTSGRKAGRVVAHQPIEDPAVEHQRTGPEVVLAGQSTDSRPGELEILTGANEIVSPPEAVVVVRTMQRLGPNSWVSSVCVWRVRLVQSAPDIAPAAKKT